MAYIHLSVDCCFYFTLEGFNMLVTSIPRFSYGDGSMQQFEKFLLLHGGVDINPRCYGQKPLPQTQSPDTLRDAKEFAAVAMAFATDMPIVGICRGAQLLCVV